MLGGEPLDGPRYIWWNFVSSSPDRIVDAAHAWRDGKFPKIPDDDVEFIPAPDDDPHFALSYHQPSDDELRKLSRRREDDRDGRCVEQSRQAVARDHQAAARGRLSRDSGQSEGERSARAAGGEVAGRHQGAASISSTCSANRRTRRRSPTRRSSSARRLVAAARHRERTGGVARAARRARGRDGHVHRRDPSPATHRAEVMTTS